jgi:hypothetical protein
MIPNPHGASGEGTAAEVVAKRAAWACRAAEAYELLDGLTTADGAPGVQLGHRQPALRR